MRKKSMNKVLAAVLLLSIITFAGLLLILGSKDGQENKGNNQADSLEKNDYLLAVTTKRVSVPCGAEVTPEMFIHSVQSVHEVSYSYEKEPDLTKYGSQEVLVRVTDAIGNSVLVKTKLNIINLKEKLELNLGADLPEAEEFLVEPGSKIVYVTDISNIDTTIPQNYSVFFNVDGDYEQTILSVDDYAAPEVTTRQAEEWLNHPMDVNCFIESATDYSTIVEIKYETEPDWSVPGEQQVAITATDSKGNSAVYYASLLLHEDVTPPIVTVSNLDVTVGGVVSYKKAINYFDDVSPLEELSLNVDNSKVNLNAVGEYDVTYVVTDFAGNSTTVVARINVVEEEPLWNDETFIRNAAEEVLAGIFREDMSDVEKIEAIYKWTKKNIRYISHSESGNYSRGAYEGLITKKGDCFVYMSTARELLNAAGIKNLVVEKSTDNPSHCWNLVYVEDGWYHLDTTPRHDNSEFFLLTDAELEAYSVSHNNSHLFNHSLYPEIK